MAINVPDLRDDVIVLRLPNEGDIDAITAACQDPDIPRFTRVPSPYTRTDAVRFVESTTTGWRADGSRGFVICDVATGALVGAISLLARDRPELSEIGYWVAADARGRGVATRAVRLLSTWGITTLGFARMELMTHIDNLASQRVAERSGFTREGVLRSYATIGCGITDVVMFSLLPRDLAENAGT